MTVVFMSPYSCLIDIISCKFKKSVEKIILDTKNEQNNYSLKPHRLIVYERKYIKCYLQYKIVDL